MISVALASFNGQRFIEAQITSILEQLGSEDELVVADNGSTDGTLDYLTKLAQKDARVSLFLNDKIPGVLANFEYALNRCRGDLIFLSDQDDLWLPNRIAIISDAFAHNPRLILVQSDASLIDEQGRQLEPSFYALRDSGPGTFKNYWRNTYQGCTLAFRRTLLDTALPFPARLPMHDMWLGILAEWLGEVKFIPDRLTLYRRHVDNKSGLKPRETRQVIRWRLDLAAALLIGWRRTVRVRRQNKVSI